jgi:hypothetical protein
LLEKKCRKIVSVLLIHCVLQDTSRHSKEIISEDIIDLDITYVSA